MTITYAALSKFPFHQREQVLADWLARYAWEVLNGTNEENDDD